jgi:hypothetical protein
MEATSLLGDIMTALNLPDPQAEERGIYAHGWVSFIGWVSGSAIALAFVVRPILVMVCVVMAPDKVAAIPDIPLGAMWPPVLAILGAGGTRVAGNLVRLREARKTQEQTLKVCAECPTRDCDKCPLKALAAKKVAATEPGSLSVSVAATASGPTA